MKLKALTAISSGLLLAAIAFQPAYAQGKAPKTVTRDELRACMNSEASLAERRKALEARKQQNSDEAAAIKQEAALMKEEQEKVGNDENKMTRFNRRVKEHNARVETANTTAAAFRTDLEALNTSLIAHNDKCAGITFDKADKDAILKEREAAAKK